MVVSLDSVSSNAQQPALSLCRVQRYAHHTYTELHRVYALHTC